MPERFLSRQQLLDRGVRPAQLRPGGPFTRVRHDLYVHEQRINFYTLVDAALHRAPADAIVSHQSAAILWGGIVPTSSTIHLSVAPDTRVRMAGVTAHRVANRAHVMLNRRRVTSAVRTFVDLAATLEPVDLVVFRDTLIAKDRVTPEELRTAAQEATGRGAARARTAAQLVRGGSESVQESKTRLLLAFAALPEPVAQLRVRDGSGTIRARPDLAYPQWKVAIFYDGKTHFDSSAQRQKDTAQREWLTRNGWQCVTIYASDLFKDPADVLARIQDAIRANGGSVRKPGVGWQRHFLAMR